MKFAVLFLILANVLTVYLEPTNWKGFSLVKLPFQYHGISPEFIDEAPQALLEVNFPELRVYLGKRVTAAQVTEQPDLVWDCNRDDFYTLVMFDCDPLGQSTRLLAEFSHWIVGNIHECDVHEGQVLTDFLPSSPAADTGFHRYVFLMFKQDGRIHFEEPFIRSIQLDGRPYTTVKHFALKYALGVPVAGNFYLCEYDQRTDETLATFGTFPEYINRAFQRASHERGRKRGGLG